MNLSLPLMAVLLLFGTQLACTKRTLQDPASSVSEGATRYAYSDPRVRLIRNDVTGEYCTATFFKPNWAITVGHCLGDKQRFVDKCNISIGRIKASGCARLPLNDTATYSLDVANTDVGMIYISPRQVELVFPNGAPGTVPLGMIEGTNSWNYRIAGYGNSNVRTTLRNGRYVPIKGGDLVGIAGADGRVHLTSCTGTLNSIADGEVPGKSGLLRLSRRTTDSSHCLPGPGDSGSPIYNSAGKVVGIAIAIKYGESGIDEAIFFKINSDAFPEVIHQALRDLKAALFDGLEF